MTRHRAPSQLVLAVSFFAGACPEAHADPSVELSGATGFGALVAGVTPARFAISPNASVSVRGEGWFFVAPVLARPAQFFHEILPTERP
ncbi:MAG: hypothetical protein ABJE95_01510 [Byssovorax sp.]